MAANCKRPIQYCKGSGRGQLPCRASTNYICEAVLMGRIQRFHGARKFPCKSRLLCGEEPIATVYIMYSFQKFFVSLFLNPLPLSDKSTVIIRINAAVFITFLVLQVRRLYEGGVYSRAAFIANFVTTSVNSLFNSRSSRERTK